MLKDIVIERLVKPANTNIKPGTANIKRVLAALHNPQFQYKTIHVTGTNGKGSVSAFLDACLRQNGYRVGKYSSPHVVAINETICLNGQQITDEDINECFQVVIKACDKLAIELSPFELLTALMFYYFALQQIDWLVLEVGMGGRDDATNVVNAQHVVITNIHEEHTAWLGNSLYSIACHKVALIKQNTQQIVVGEYSKQLFSALKEHCSTKQLAALCLIPRDYYYTSLDCYADFTARLKIQQANMHDTASSNCASDGHGASNYCLQDFKLGVFGGAHQGVNFLCAYAVLSKMGIPNVIIKKAVAAMTIPYRLQRITTKPVNLIVDASHNPSGARVLAHALHDYCLPTTTVMVVSILKDKDIAGMLKYYKQIANNIIFTDLANYSQRAASIDILVAKAKECNFGFIQVVNEPKNALAYATNLATTMVPSNASNHGMPYASASVVVAGSFYLLSAIKMVN